MPKRSGALPGLFVGLTRWAIARSGFKALAVAVLLIAGPVASAVAGAPDSAIVVDAKTGKVLFSSAADSSRFPASLTKMMTLYLLFEAIDSGKSSLDAKITMSAYAASQAPTKLGLKPGQTISVRDAILALVTKSANDVAVAIAEYLGGSESSFAARMTTRAHELGMSRTTFRNASGLPNSGQITTARDLATLGRALRDHFPEYYSYFATPSFVWHGRRIANHNRLLGRVDGVNGIKTGYTRASGYNLVTSVDRGGRKIVAVVMGGDTGRLRDKRMASLIETYLPLASRGPRTAKPIPGEQVTDSPALVASADAAAPIPNLRPDAAVVAAANETTDNVPAPETVASVAPLAAAAATDVVVAAAAPPATASAADLVGANSVFALEATDEGDAAAGDEVADAPPAAAVPKGWRIQIAASPSQSSAEDILDRALAKGSKVLANASPYTEPVQSGSTTLYRARFAGFTSKEAARAACVYLVKQKFDCMAVAN
jgi:D-alanyl-D-alanine carboxypeptidase